MNGDELKRIRTALGAGVVTFGRAIGYSGSSNTISRLIRRYELGRREIPQWVEAKAKRLEIDGLPLAKSVASSATVDSRPEK